MTTVLKSTKSSHSVMSPMKSTHSVHSMENDSFFDSVNASQSVEQSHAVPLTGAQRDEWKNNLTPAFEKTLIKEKCGFCKMYFHRNSVNYKVPNHRIFELQKSWNLVKEGRRYSNAAFLYRMVDVCTFCAQFFAVMPADYKPIKDDRVGEGKPIKLQIETKIARSDIAVGQKAYQSSCVDGKSASNAVTPPYGIESRTRRQLDPWWELDFGRQFHIQSLRFRIATGIRQKLNISIFLLGKAFGFEDPFVNTIGGKAIAQKEIQLQPRAASEMEDIEWELPPETICSAVRVQLSGIHILCLQRFQAFQGDAMVYSTLDDTAEDAALSCATLSPDFIKKARHDMISPEKRKKMIAEVDFANAPPSRRENVRATTVPFLRSQIDAQYHSIQNWKDRVLDCASIFPENEIVAIYKVIFKYAADHNINDRDATIHEYDLLGNALTFHYPRCQLHDLSKRIRAVLNLIHQRSQLKQLLGLHNSENFVTVSNDSSYYVKQLNNVFDKLNNYWDRKDQKEKMHRLRTNDLGFAGTKASEARGCSWSQFIIIMRYFCTLQVKNIPKMAFNVDFKRGADSGAVTSGGGMGTAGGMLQQTGGGDGTGGVFLTAAGDGYVSPVGAGGELDTASLTSLTTMSTSANAAIINNLGSNFNPVMDLFAQGMANANNTTTTNNNTGANNNNNSNNNTGGMLLSASLPSFHSGGYGAMSGRATPAAKRPTTTEMAHVDQRNYADYLASPVFNRALIPSRSQEASNAPKLLADVVREQSQFEPYNSSFSEYKFDNFKQRVAMEPTFPKTLSLDFAKTLIPKRASTSHGKSIREMLAEGAAAQQKLQQGSAASGAGDDDFDNRSHSTRFTNNDMAGLVGDNTIFAPGAHGEAARQRGMVTSGGGGGGTPLPGTPTTPGMGLQRTLTSSKSMRKMMSLTKLALDPNAVAGANASAANSPHPGMTPTNLTPKGGPPNRLGRLKTVGRFVTNMTRTPLAATAPAAVESAFDNFSIADFESDDSGDFGSSFGDKKEDASKAISVVFYKVCALCELKFPAQVMGNKVLRKHLVTLRASWDPALVSKDIRKLDNTISMYNLVNVCQFCAQFFDPDFPDGIAYPTRLDSPVPKVKGTVAAIRSQSVVQQLIPFYDVRYPQCVSYEDPGNTDASTLDLSATFPSIPNRGTTATAGGATSPGVSTRAGADGIGIGIGVAMSSPDGPGSPSDLSGRVFERAQTKESRERAKKARNIAQDYAMRQESFRRAQEVSRAREERIQPSSRSGKYRPKMPTGMTVSAADLAAAAAAAASGGNPNSSGGDGAGIPGAAAKLGTRNGSAKQRY